MKWQGNLSPLSSLEIDYLTVTKFMGGLTSIKGKRSDASKAGMPTYQRSQESIQASLPSPVTGWSLKRAVVIEVKLV